MTLDALVVIPAVVATAYGTVYGLLAAPIAAKWVMERTLPILVGGTVLAVSTGLAVLRGAWLWMTGTLDEAEDKLAEAIERKKPRADYAEKTSSDRPGRTIEIDFDAPIEESVERIERA